MPGASFAVCTQIDTAQVTMAAEFWLLRLDSDRLHDLGAGALQEGRRGATRPGAGGAMVEIARPRFGELAIKSVLAEEAL